MFFFVMNVLNSVNYLKHVCSFEVAETQNWVSVAHKNLLYHVPLWSRLWKNVQVVCLKHSL